jgi:hypothetical protein
MRARAHVFGCHMRVASASWVRLRTYDERGTGAEEEIKKAKQRDEGTVSTASGRSHRAVTRISERTQIFAYDPRRADAWKRGGLITPPTWAVL